MILFGSNLKRKAQYGCCSDSIHCLHAGTVSPQVCPGCPGCSGFTETLHCISAAAMQLFICALPVRAVHHDADLSPHVKNLSNT